MVRAYAPASLRAGQAFRKVLGVGGLTVDDWIKRAVG